jgi:hypothetical protein
MAVWPLSLLAPQSIEATIATGIVTGLFGAVLGAWITGRRDTKRQVIEELNSLRAARAICFSICNKFLALKSQHILDLHRDYFLDREELQAAHAVAQAGGAPAIVQVRADYQTLTPIWFPIEGLQRLMFDKINVGGRGLVTAIELISAIDAITKAIEYRNQLCAEFLNKPPQNQREIVERYFGIPSAARSAVDERFVMSVNALYNQTDDCIFYSRSLAEELFAYNLRRWRRYRWRYRLRLPKPAPEDWSLAISRGLMPHSERYASWERGFRSTQSWRSRVVTWWKRLRGQNPPAQR